MNLYLKEKKFKNRNKEDQARKYITLRTIREV